MIRKIVKFCSFFLFFATTQNLMHASSRLDREHLDEFRSDLSSKKTKVPFVGEYFSGDRIGLKCKFKNFEEYKEFFKTEMGKAFKEEFLKNSKEDNFFTIYVQAAAKGLLCSIMEDTEKKVDLYLEQHSDLLGLLEDAKNSSGGAKGLLRHLTSEALVKNNEDFPVGVEFKDFSAFHDAESMREVAKIMICAGEFKEKVEQKNSSLGMQLSLMMMLPIFGFVSLIWVSYKVLSAIFSSPKEEPQQQPVAYYPVQNQQQPVAYYPAEYQQEPISY